MPDALEGITIADFSQMMQGPWGTMALADVGADVVKIEPIGGEYERHLSVGGEMYEGKSPYYLAMNRNKRSVAVDLKDDRGKEVARDVVAEADVVVENFRPASWRSWTLATRTSASTTPTSSTRPRPATDRPVRTRVGPGRTC